MIAREIDMTPAEYALLIAHMYAGADGADHKAFAIDQMVRALTNCPIIIMEAKDVHGRPYTYMAQGESEEYKTFVANYEMGEAGPHSYEWEIGIAP